MVTNWLSRRKGTIYFLSVMLVVVSLIQCSSSHKEEPKDKSEIVIAIISSLTGGLAENGKDMANGAKMAFEETNSDGGINGNLIKFEMFDDQADPKTAVSVANRVCQDKRFVAVVGHLTSGCMSAAASTYSKEGMPVVMPVPTNPEITRKGHKNLFRVPPTDDDQAPFLAKYILSKDPAAPVAVVSDLTAYGVGFATAFRDTFQSNGGNIVAFDGAQKDSRDFRTLIAKIKEQKPKYVILGATYDMGAPFVKQMKELGLNATVFSGDGCYGSAFIEQAGNAAEGTIVSFIAPDRHSSPGTEKFFKKYEELYGKVVSFAPLGYDAAKTIIEAIKKSDKITRQGILDSLHSSSFIVNGITGKIQFDKNGDNKNKNLVLYEVQEGEFRLFK